jgi:hypothetical protein
MPRKQYVRALGSKPNELGTKRKNSPGRYHETTEKLGQGAATGGKRCVYAEQRETSTGETKLVRCKNEGTNFVRWAWRCDAHIPPPDPNCPHEQWSPLWGRKVCSLCTIDLGPLPERVPR